MRQVCPAHMSERILPWPFLVSEGQGFPCLDKHAPEQYHSDYERL